MKYPGWGSSTYKEKRFVLAHSPSWYKGYLGKERERGWGPTFPAREHPQGTNIPHKPYHLEFPYLPVALAAIFPFIHGIGGHPTPHCNNDLIKNFNYSEIHWIPVLNNNYRVYFIKMSLQCAFMHTLVCMPSCSSDSEASIIGSVSNSG